jgi:hypothetical protein
MLWDIEPEPNKNLWDQYTGNVENICYSSLSNNDPNLPNILFLTICYFVNIYNTVTYYLIIDNIAY